MPNVMKLLQESNTVTPLRKMYLTEKSAGVDNGAAKETFNAVLLTRVKIENNLNSESKAFNKSFKTIYIFVIIFLVIHIDYNQCSFIYFFPLP